MSVPRKSYPTVPLGRRLPTLPIFRGPEVPPVVDVIRSSILGSPQERIVFVHIPKCGGTSVKNAITRKFGYGRDRFGGRGILNISAVASKRAATAAGMTSERFREHLLLFGMAHPGVRFISGHISFSHIGQKEFGDTWRFVTLLREPVSKWFSQYFYNRYKKSEHSRVEEELEEFLDTPTAAAYGSDYVRLLSSVEDDPTSREAINSALENLARFSVLGVLEDMERFRESFRSNLGFDIRVGVTNRNPVSAKKQDSRITPEIRRRVEGLCAANSEVYEAVRIRTRG